MPRKRHRGECEERIVLRSFAANFPSGYRIEPHAHPWGQVVYATAGVVIVGTAEGSWVVPSHRAAWVPAGTRHEVQTHQRVRMRTVYVHPDLSAPLPAGCCVLSVSPLLRELVLEIIRRGMLVDDVPEDHRLARVFVDQVRVTPQAPLDLAWPRDRRARRLAEKVRSDVAVSDPLAVLARDCGAGARTLERLFVAETGLTFGKWRQQARLLHALRLLAAGESVTDTALSVGFGSPSAFIAMFRRALGMTPREYFREQTRSG